MARAYLADLRRKLLKAHKEQEGALTALAAWFRVSVKWAKALAATKGRRERMEKPAVRDQLQGNGYRSRQPMAAGVVYYMF